MAKMTAYLDASRAMCFTTAEVGASVKDVSAARRSAAAGHRAHVCSPDECRAVAASLTAMLQLASSEGSIAFVAESLGQLDATTRGHMDATYLRDVLEPLQTRMGLFGPLRSQMRERELIKMDFDARYRKVKSLKAAGASGGGSTDAAALPKKEQKLRDTAETLRTLTDAIYKTQDTVAADVFAVLGPAFSAFLRSQRRFFTVKGTRCTHAWHWLARRPATTSTTTIVVCRLHAAASVAGGRGHHHWHA